MKRFGVTPGAAQATSCDGIVHVAGQVAWGPNGDVVGENDSVAQAQQVFANLRSVLDDVGSDLSDVVSLTCYLTDAAHFAGYATVKAALFGDQPPASTTVVVAALLDPRLSIEVAAVAVAGGQR